MAGINLYTLVPRTCPDSCTLVEAAQVWFLPSLYIEAGVALGPVDVFLVVGGLVFFWCARRPLFASDLQRRLDIAGRAASAQRPVQCCGRF